MKEQTWHIDPEQIPNGHTLVYEFEVFHFSWELDNYGWIVLDENKYPYIATTSHGNFIVAPNDFIADKVLEYMKVIQETSKAREVYLAKMIELLNSIVDVSDEQL